MSEVDGDLSAVLVQTRSKTSTTKSKTKKIARQIAKPLAAATGALLGTSAGIQVGNIRSKQNNLPILPPLLAALSAVNGGVSGGMAGYRAGRSIGNQLGGAINRIAGKKKPRRRPGGHNGATNVPRGIMTSTAPIAYATTIANKPINSTPTANGIRLVGSELSAKVFTTGAGVTQSTFVIHPFDGNLPALAAYAVQYAKYRVRRFRLHFIPSVGTTILGKLVLFAQKDTSQPQPTDTESAARLEHHVIFPVYQPNVQLDAVPNDRELIVKKPSTPDAESLYNYGKWGVLGSELQSAVGVNLPANTALGHVVAEYDVECYDRLPAAAETDSLALEFTVPAASAISVTAAATTPSEYGLFWRWSTRTVAGVVRPALVYRGPSKYLRFEMSTRALADVAFSFPYSLHNTAADGTLSFPAQTVIESAPTRTAGYANDNAYSETVVYTVNYGFAIVFHPTVVAAAQRFQVSVEPFNPPQPSTSAW